MLAGYGSLQDLFQLIQTRPVAEAAEIVLRIRRGSDPHAVLRLLRDGDLLLEASATARRSADEARGRAVERVEAAALHQSPVKVPARPWTDVAGDGVVSELVSIFFAIEQPFIATYVDRRCFVEEMRAAKPGRDLDFCSPLLVDAICAYSAVSSPVPRLLFASRP